MKTDTLTSRPCCFTVILVIAIILSAVDVRAQSAITNTSIELVGSTIQITYDIANSKRSERYNVRLEVTDSKGNLLPVTSLEGDVGEDIPGGTNKKIIWDLEADNIQMNEDIFFELFADAIVEPDPEPPKKEEVTLQQQEPSEEEVIASDRSDQSEEEEIRTGENGSAKEFTRRGIILQSLALPGLGLSRAKGGPHWLRGVAGYGAVVGAVILNNMARATYEDYRTPGSADEARTLLDKSTRQDNISEICAYAAIGIWVSDLVWTFVGSSDLNKSRAADFVRPVSLGTDYDPLCGVPLLAIRYKF